MDHLFTKLQHRKFAIRTNVHSLHKGMRSARHPGSSLEFSDYRLYQFGDDIRQIDWNVYGRTEKYYIKRFLDEKEITIALYLDCSRSMQISQEKWQLARQLAASFAFIALIQNDRLSFIPGKKETHIITRKGSAFARALFQQISQLPGDTGNDPFTLVCKKNLLKNRELALVITDGLEPVENWGDFLHRLASSHKSVRFLQLLARDEVAPEFTGDRLLVDSESQQEVNVSMSGKVISLYRERLQEHNKKIARLCSKYGCSYMQVETGENLEEILLRKCMQHGWLE